MPTAGERDSIDETLLDLLRVRAARQPELRVYEYADEGDVPSATLTFAELDRQARAIAALIQSQTKPGDRVLLLHPHGLDYVAAFYACVYAGVIAVPAFPPDPVRGRRGESRLAAIVADAQASLALTTQSVIDAGHVSLVSDLTRAGITLVATDTVARGSESAWREPVLTSSHLALLQYTSGSTTTPRGVMLSHENMLKNAEIQRNAWRLSESSVGVSWLPLYHDLGMISCVIQPVFTGFPTLMMTASAFMQRPIRWLRAISRSHGTFAGGPNFAFDICVRKTSESDRAGLDLSSWDCAFNGAEPIRPETLKAFSETFASNGFRPESMYPCYGLAEANFVTGGAARRIVPVVRTFDRDGLERGIATASPASTPIDRQRALVGCGGWRDGQDIRIVNAESRDECASGQLGEIWIGGKSVAQGYWHHEDESENTFRARLNSDGDGQYFRTGDLGFTHDGELYITGRLKDLVIVRGLNHYPQDIERTVERVHASFRAGCSAAFSVDVQGEERLVVAQEFDGDAKSGEKLFDAIRQAVAEEHDLQLYGAVLIRPGSISKTTSGKIQRRATKAAFLEGTLAAIASWQQPALKATPSERLIEPSAKARNPTAQVIEQWLVSWVSRALGVEADRLDIREPVARYGFDSRLAIELSRDLEDWLGRRIATTIAYAYPSVAALTEHLSMLPHTDVARTRNAPRQVATEPIAVVGIGCRFPGAPDPKAYWDLLRLGVDAITDIPSSRWDGSAYFNVDPSVPGKTNTRWGGFLENVDRFDPLFFGISPREATHIDPQQRLILEVAWEALEDAGIPASSLARSMTGVFIGVTTDDYGKMQWRRPRLLDSYSATGTFACIAANRISYVFDLRGPSLAIDTACSASLVSIHSACQSLWSGESTLALAGGVNVILSPETTISQSKLGSLAADGRCKAFDARADGPVRGEGAGVVVLKRLSDALADGDRVYAVVRGSAVNQDGRSNGLTAPNPDAQEAVLREAYRHAGVSPGSVQYVEAHGTGTRLGDPIEASALGEVLSEGRAKGDICALGSVKTNFGHLESAAGVAGFIKVVLSLAHRQIPPSLHYTLANPHIRFESLPLRVQTKLAEWPSTWSGRIAGVSAFGMGGTNAHIVLSDAPERSSRRDGERGSFLLAVSARSTNALAAQASAFKAALESTDSDIADVCYTAGVRREHHEHRLAIVGSTPREMRDALEQYARGDASRAWFLGRRPAGARPKIAFVFSGQGAQHAAMGKELFATETVFADAIRECDRAFLPMLGWSIVEALTSETPEMEQTDRVQPVLFSIQVALTALWSARGVVPDAVVGHSLGEVAAAHVAGALSLADACRIVVLRSQLLRRISGQGEMAVVGLSLADAQAVVDPESPLLSVALSNSPSSTVLAGDREALARVLAVLTARGVFCRPIKTDGAGHCYVVEPLRPELVAGLSGLVPRESRLAFYSSVTGRSLPGTSLDATYWGRNLREPVVFSTAIQKLAEDGYVAFVEISPHPLLTSSVQQCLEHMGRDGIAVGSLRRDEPDGRSILSVVAALYCIGVSVDLRALQKDRGEVVTLPSYAWQRQKFWLETDDDNEEADDAARHPLIRRSLREASGAGRWHFELDVTAKSPAFMLDHVLQGVPVFNSLAFAEMALAAGIEALGPGDYAVANLEYKLALFVPASVPRTVQLMLTADDQRGATFEIVSRETDDPRGAWTRHVTGAIVVEAPTLDRFDESSRNEVLARCSAQIDGEIFLGRFEAQGAHFGPRFTGLKRAWQGDGEALAEIVPPHVLAGEAERYYFHPGLLDACAQALLATDPTTHAFLPISIDRVRLHTRPEGRLWSYAKAHTGGKRGVLSGDVRIYSEHGDPVADVLGARLQYLDQLGASGPSDSVDSWCYSLAWNVAPKDKVDPLPYRASAPGTWIIFADRVGVGTELVRVLREKGHRCVVVSRSESFARKGRDEFECASGSIASVRAAIAQALDGEHQFPAHGVVYLWALDAPPNGAPIDAEARDLGCTVPVAVVQELSSRATDARLWLVTRGGVAIESDRTSASAAQAAVWGVGRTIAIEHAHVWGKLIDLDPSRTGQDSANHLWSEIDRAGEEDQIAFRNDDRYVPRLTRTTNARDGLRKQRTWHKDGTYLITGGLGGIGLVVARWMVEQGARRLLLLGRSGLPSRALWSSVEAGSSTAQKIAAVREIESLGASVHVAAVDMGDPAAVRRCLDAFEGEGWPAIRGVIHAAAVSNVCAVTSLTSAAIDADFRPKVVGAWALDEWFGSRPLDFFVAFSSLTAVLPSPFLASYAAASSFVDALMADRNARGLAGISIDWGMWSEVGLSVRHQQAEQRDQSWSVGSFSVAQGLEAFATALAQQGPLTVMARMDWRAYAKAYPTAAATAPLRDLTLPATTALKPPNAIAAERESLRALDPNALRTRVGEILGTLASRILRIGETRIDPLQTLDKLGLDSLMAAELRNAVISNMGVAVPIVSFLNRPTLADLGAQIVSLIAETQRGSEASGPKHIDHGGKLALSPSQEGLWYLDQIAPGSTVYLVTLSHRIEGVLDLDALESALNALVQRHEALRTTFPVVDGAPVQRIAESATVELRRADLGSEPEIERSLAISRWLETESTLPVDLAVGPLFRASLARLSEREHLFAIGLHHIVTDGWSVRIVAEDLAALYAAAVSHQPSKLEPVFQLADFVVWQQKQLQGAHLEKLTSFWTNALAGAPTLLALPTDRPRSPIQSFRGGTVPVVLPPQLLARATDLARQEGATLFMSLFAALSIVLGRHAAQEDFVIGSPIANRGASEFDRSVGFFINMLPIRADLTGDPTFRALVARIRDIAHAAYGHQELPFGEIVRALGIPREPSHAPLFQVEMALQPPLPPLELEGCLPSVPEIVEDGTARFDLYFDLIERHGGISGGVEFNTDLFDRETVERIVSEFTILLTAASSTPDVAISRLPLLDAAGRARLVNAWNQTDVAYPDDVLVHRMIEAQAARTPDAVALRFGRQQMTYAEFDAHTNQLARSLIDHGVGPEVRVGLFFERCFEMVISIVAVLKAGGAYVPVDPDYPSARIEFMLSDAAPTVLLTHSSLREKLQIAGIPAATHVICVDETSNRNSHSADAIRDNGLRPDHLAYVIYTSGSTGQPKGAMNTHHALANRLLWMQDAYRLDASDRVLQKTPYSFDVSVWEFLWPLMTGAVLSIAKPGGHRDPSYLRETIVSEGITTIHFVPSMLQAFLLDDGVESCASLRRVICSGEALPFELQESFFARSKAELHNLYGPTEAAIDVTAWACVRSTSAQRRIVPIGKPIANTQMYILDPHGDPTPIGVAGELFIAGRNVGRGYLNRPDLTAASFVKDPFSKREAAKMYKTGDLARWLSDGNIEYLGRRDLQVKLRGMRIELGEIEDALGQHPGVRECVVILRTMASGDPRLIAYWVAQSESSNELPDPGALRAMLLARLPEHMVPSSFVQLSTMPLSPNGKVDRNSLPAPDVDHDLINGSRYVAPRTELEAVLARAFAKALGVAEVGIRDDFFEVGGHSLLAARMAFELRRTVGRDVPLGSIGRAPTVEQLAAVLEGTAPREDEPDLAVESELDAAIVPQTPISEFSSMEPRSIFLTGATGFVGASLLHELLTHTAADVHCLVRASSDTEARRRIMEVQAQYGLSADVLVSRIVPVCGDLTQPKLGLSDRQFDALAEQIDVIFHSGAAVNFVRPYATLRSANVLGTQEILRLAVQSRLKPIHYISTIAVLSGSVHRGQSVLFEEPLGDRFDGLPISYAQSKWVAERLIQAAASRGIPVAVYRLGQVMGHSGTGHAQTGDFVAQFLQGCLELGATIASKAPIDFVPVDYVARAIVTLACRSRTETGTVYHIVNPNPPRWSHVVEMLRESGYLLDELNFAEWFKLVLAAAESGQSNPLGPYVSVLEDPAMRDALAHVPEFDQRNTAVGLAGSRVACPEFNTAYLRTILGFYVESGTIPESSDYRVARESGGPPPDARSTSGYFQAFRAGPLAPRRNSTSR